ncbi:GRIP and coiled-coil domain-containing protein 1 [Hypomesus transpacificus]|uniref:GRIP and coiled-coil domain-containing protein 1 n=1 Tax=Hypomesus transpacificus TaxID=137520 RepID=UPI001F07A26B|nr:GRIP and coiled-coil domain-containing protein 1 [Hypomesus transpacificus]XP_046878387.1 GRIP and coiled-coil domain-containing protein 1 [Hypomesus transpacificus]XP_046878388.1 GRIP and coiled-coil domain-containing protein 1 [Hypomesus transpacificus]
MEKFGMTFGGGPSKKELLDTIDGQKKQLIQYQTRFKDVVRAYKSLLKEKEALEASLKVLTVSQEVDFSQRNEDGSLSAGFEHPVPPDLADDHCSLHSEDSLDTAASADTATSINSGSTKGDQAEEEPGSSGAEVGASGPGGPSMSTRSEEASGSESGISSSSSGSSEQQSAVPSTSTETDRRVLQLKTQLTTLTSSLATVTQEKSRMEASFQADKRKMKQEFDELQGRLEEARRQHEAEFQALQDQLAESKARVITQQHEREQEQGDHALMLRELQKLLQEERGQRQDAELKLEDAREALMETTQAADRGLDYEARLKEVIQEREEIKRSLQVAEVEKSKPDPRVDELQQEIAELKSHFHQQLQQEIKKASQAEERVRELAQAEEGRVASLEERVSELSELLGACERARQKDQQTTHRLRERILQLDTENKTLAIAASNRGSSDLTMDENNLDVNVLKERLEKVKKLLVLASRKSPEHVPDIEKLAQMEGELGTGPGGESSDGEKTSVLYYQQELRQLKEEFERYKVRAQVVLKNKNAKDGSQAKELEEARDQLAELKEKYINLRIHSDESEAKHRRELEERQQGLATQQQSHKQELDKTEVQHRESLLRLEGELHRQRDRTMALLAEKDQELEKLRGSVSFSHGLAAQRGRSSGDEKAAADSRAPADGGSGYSADSTMDDQAQEESDIFAQALRLAMPSEPTLLLYAEQLARKEVEIGCLRRQKRRLEEDQHQMQGKLIANGERYDEEVAELRDQLDKLLRDQGREGSNLEYLKNVIYKFLTLQDTSGRQQTLTAILTILHFSPQEKQTVFKLQGQSWWATAGKR